MTLPKINQIQVENSIVYALDNEGIIWKYDDLGTKKDKNQKSKGWKKVDNYTLEE